MASPTMMPKRPAKFRGGSHRPGPANPAAREEARLRTLRGYAVLDTPPEAAFERIVQLAARFLRMPMAHISFVERDRQWLKAMCGLESRETPRRITFCTHAIEDDDVMVVPDATRDARFAANPLVTGKPFLRFYAGAPLRAPDGQKLGTLCVLDTRPRRLAEAGREILRELARTVVDELELRRTAADLRLQVEQRERAERELVEALHSVETQVEARTAELSRRHEQLRAEMAGRREAELALRESEVQFRELTGNIQEVFWICEVPALELIYISPAYEIVWGRPLAANGLLPIKWIDTIHPDDREWVVARFANWASSDRFELEYRILRPDGTTRWLYDRAFAISDGNGKPYRLAGIATDITERKQQEAVATLRARQQQVVAELGEFALTGGEVDALLREAVRVVRATLSLDICMVAEYQPERHCFVPRAALGTPGDALPTAEILDGRRSGSGYALLTAGPVIMPDLDAEDRFEVSRWVRDGKARSGVTVPVGGEGTDQISYGTFNVYTRTLRMFSPDDVFFLQGVAHVLGAAISRRRGEEALRVAKEEAELANSAKSSFLSRMSHELRTPLNAILGFSQLLQMDDPTARQQECLKHVLTSGQLLLAMIDDVLDISRLDLDRGALAAEAVVPRVAAGTVIELIRPLAAPRRVVVRLEDSPAADRAVLVNRRRFDQILLNLLTNAVKYNREGGRVTVSCRLMPAARLRIIVSDTGPGISPDNIARLYVPFERLGAERTDVPGTGLGLALCKNLVEAQGGQIGVESAVGRGSDFWVQLPLAPPSPPAPATPTAPPASPAPFSPPPPPARRAARRRARTILYVEDNLSNLRLIERLLQRRPGIRLMTAATGQDGLELARRCRPDLVLLDLHLPDIPGGEVLAALRASPDTREVPVVVVSADALPANIDALLAAGARDYLTKPLDVHKLVDLLSELA